MRKNGLKQVENELKWVKTVWNEWEMECKQVEAELKRVEYSLERTETVWNNELWMNKWTKQWINELDRAENELKQVEHETDRVENGLKLKNLINKAPLLINFCSSISVFNKKIETTPHYSSILFTYH